MSLIESKKIVQTTRRAIVNICYKTFERGLAHLCTYFVAWKQKGTVIVLTLSYCGVEYLTTRNDYSVKSTTGDLSHRYVNPRRSAIISAVINGRVNLRDKQAERGRAMETMSRTQCVELE